MSTVHDYRLTESDELAVRVRVAEVIDGWRQGSPSKSVDGSSTSVATLVRIGAHSIGCSTDDLRDVELDWIEAEVRGQLTDRLALRIVAMVADHRRAVLAS